MVNNLIPRIYAKGMNWSLMPKNSIDTVTCKPILNTLTKQNLIHTENITKITISGTEKTLPIGADEGTNRYCFMFNKNNKKDKHMAEGIIASTVIQGSYTLKLNNPLPLTPTAKVVLQGTTHYINRGTFDLDTLRTLSATTLGSYIINNENGNLSFSNGISKDTVNRPDYPDLIDYTQSTIPMYPFVRTYNSDVIDATFKPRVSPSKILTDWRQGQDTGRTTAHYDEWNTYGQENTIGLYGNVILSGGVTNQRIPIPKRNIDIKVNVTKVDDYNYTIDYEVPVRYVYGASAIYLGPLGGEHSADSYAFIDLISQINLEIYSQELSEETVDKEYSLDDNDNLTTEVLNENIFAFSKNEFITLDATWSQNNWITAMSKYILDNYKKGKHIIDVQVPGKWAIQNNVTINSQFYVKQQNGQLITLKGSPVIFEVKNIEKNFALDSFVYILKLLEV